MWSGTAAGARDGAGNKGGPISSRLPTTQRAARPGSPAPTFPARRARPGQPDEHRPCSPPRFWCARRQKRGENPCPSLSLDLVRVDGMQPHGSQTWGEPKGRHSVTRPCRGGRVVGAQSEGATALPRRVQRRRSAACVLPPNTPCMGRGRPCIQAAHGVSSARRPTSSHKEANYQRTRRPRTCEFSRSMVGQRGNDRNH